MPNFAQPVEMSFIISTVVIIFVFIGLGIVLVKQRKKSQ